MVGEREALKSMRSLIEFTIGTNQVLESGGGLSKGI